MATSARLDELKKKFDENPRRYFAPLANEYRKLGDLTQAISICRAHLPNQLGHISGHIVLAQALYEARELGESRQLFEASLELDPENLIALRYLGDIAREQDDPTSARGWYERVLDADPRNDEIAQLLREVAGPPAAQAATFDDDFSTRPTPADAAVVGPTGVAEERNDTHLDQRHDLSESSIQSFVTGDSPASGKPYESQSDPFAADSRAASLVDPFAEEPATYDASAPMGELAAAAELTADDWFAPPSAEGIAPFESAAPVFSDALFPDLSVDQTITPRSSRALGDELSFELPPIADSSMELSADVAAAPEAAGQKEPERDWRESDPTGAPSSPSHFESASVAPSRFDSPEVDARSDDPSNLNFDATPHDRSQDPSLEAGAESRESIWASTPAHGDSHESSSTGDPRTDDGAGAIVDEWQPIPEDSADVRGAEACREVAADQAFELSDQFAPDERQESENVSNASTVSVNPFVDAALGISQGETEWDEDEVAPLDGLLSMEAGSAPADAELADPSHSLQIEDFSVDAVHAQEVLRSEFTPTSFVADPIFGRTPLLDDVTPSPTPAGFVTETMAELYLQQGFTVEALAIYRQLLDRDPGDEALQERVAMLEGGASASMPEHAAPHPRHDREGQSVRSFFARFARRSATRTPPPEGNARDGAEIHDAGAAPSSEHAVAVPGAERFSGAATRAEALTVPDDLAPAESSLTTLFDDSPSREDEVAASTLSLAFSAGPGVEPGESGSVSAGSESEGSSQEKELSLDHLFRDVPARSTGAVTLDEYYAGSPGPDSDPGGARSEDPEEHDADIEQFTAWLEGLKKK